MKKLVLLSAIAISGLFYNTANAQFRVHLGTNLFPNRVIVAPRPEVEEPVYADADYNNDDYYYLPDVDAYYNINQQCYYYFDGDNWISAAFLPGEYHDFDWRNARRYEVREARPYLHNDFYINHYRGNQYTFNRDNFHSGFDNHDRGFRPDDYRQQYGDNRNTGRFNDHQNQNNWDHNQQQGWVNENNGWDKNQYGNRWNNGGDRNNNHQQQPVHNQGNQNHNDGGRENEQRFAQNNQSHGGHGGGGWNRF